ncbi:MAG TPA: tetratricopeptide repeat protein [Chthoniobacter sp.]|jgi:tetratricopeptide (TPR) repeat protein
MFWLGTGAACLFAVAVVWFLIHQRANRGDSPENPASPVSTRCETAAAAAQCVLDAAPMFDFWTSSAELWPAKQFSAAAQFRCPPDRLKDELAKELPEIAAAAPRAGKLARLRWVQAGDVAMALFHLPEAEQYYQRAIELPAAGSDAPRWQLDAKLADVYHAEGKYDVESLQRKLSAGGRENAGQPDPAPLMSATRMAVCLHDLHRPDEALALLDDRLKSAAEPLDKKHPDVWVARAFHSLLLRETHQPTGCEAELRQMLADALRVFGKDDAQTALAQARLVLFLTSIHREADVEQMASDAIRRLEKWYGQEHPVTRLVIRYVGLAAAQAGDTEKAQLLLGNLLKMDRKNLPENDPQIGDDLDGLAVIASKMNRFSEAESYLRDALKCYQASLPPNAPKLKTCLRNLAGLQARMDGRDDVEVETRRLVAANEAAHPEGSLNLARGLHNLGTQLYKQGHLGEAEKDLRRSCEMLEKFTGPDAMELANALQNLGDFLIHGQQSAEAEAILRRVLAMKEKQLGPSDPELVETLCVLGRAEMGTRSWPDAERSLKRATELSMHTLGRENVKTSEALSSLTKLYQAAGRLKEALPLQRQVLANVERNFGRESPNYTIALNSVATTLAGLDRNDEAEEMMQQAIAIDESLRPDETQFANHLSNLASVYSHLHKTSEADALYRRALGILVRRSKVAGADLPELRNVSSSYSNFLKVAGLKQDEISTRVERVRQGEEVVGL